MRIFTILPAAALSFVALASPTGAALDGDGGGKWFALAKRRTTTTAPVCDEGAQTPRFNTSDAAALADRFRTDTGAAVLALPPRTPLFATEGEARLCLYNAYDEATAELTGFAVNGRVLDVLDRCCASAAQQSLCAGGVVQFYDTNGLDLTARVQSSTQPC